jgi:very-short-patch-repair endonuclease
VAEQRLWQAIRNRQLDGLKLVRQMAIGPYDLACRQGRRGEATGPDVAGE